MRLKLICLISLVLFSSSTFAKTCKKGQPCGNSCISWKYTCHKGNTSSSSKSQFSNSGSSSSYKSSATSTYERPIKESGVDVKYMYVTANKLKVRSGPGQKYQAIGTLTKGEKVRVFRSVQSSSWLAVYYGSGNYWVSAKYLSEDKPD